MEAKLYPGNRLVLKSTKQCLKSTQQCLEHKNNVRKHKIVHKSTEIALKYYNKAWHSVYSKEQCQNNVKKAYNII